MCVWRRDSGVERLDCMAQTVGENLRERRPLLGLTLRGTAR
jgi:hypothetical protein